MMKIKISRNWMVSIGVTVLLLGLAFAIGSALAQEPDGEEGAEAAISAAAVVNSRISYQGVLSEGGSPVTGSRDMVFRLYRNSTCTTQVGGDIAMPGVAVTDGLFNAVLDVDPSHFDGRGLWLEVEVEGTAIGCREILPSPYALSLRPGAEIDGASSGTSFGDAVLNINNDVNITHDYPGVYVRAVTGSAVRGESGGIGVYGYSDFNYGVRGKSINSSGGYFSSDNGVGIQVSSEGSKIYDHGGTFNAAEGYGIYASSQHNYAVMAVSNDRTAVRAYSEDDSGVSGGSDNDDGVEGWSNHGYGVYGTSYGSALDSGYGGYFTSWYYRGLYARGGGGNYAAYLDGNIYVNGNFYASGSKTGYVVDLALNQGPENLERGDVVVIAGSAPPVMGDIPVIEVRKAGAAGSTAVMGVVDGHVSLSNEEFESSKDSPIQSGEYLSVVTLGAFESVKVDASYGAVAPGDLLVSSTTGGHAMKAVDPGPGTIIGKALDSLEAGQGSISVLVTLQ